MLLLNACHHNENIQATVNPLISMNEKDGDITFTIDDFERGIISIIVIDSKNNEILWDVNLNYFKSKEIVYGEMNQFPNDVFATQVLPEKIKPKNLRGRSIIVRIGIQYDSRGSARSKTIEQKYNIQHQIGPSDRSDPQ